MFHGSRIILYSLIEITGVLPETMRVLQLALLAKAAGGFRPIGLFSSGYRLWGRAPRNMASDWEAAHPRQYLAASAFNGASDVVWRQSLRSELGVRKKQAAATLLWDLRKFYEGMRLDLLEQRAAALGFPEQITSVCLTAYRGARFVTMASISTGPFYSINGVIAGCSMATTFVRIYVMPVFDTLDIPRSVMLDIYIDDYGMSSVDLEHIVRQDLKEAAVSVMQAIQQDMCCSVSEDKSAVVASNSRLGKDLSAFLGVYAGPKPAPSAVTSASTTRQARPGGRLEGARSISNV